ncbi:MAG: protein arginine kinase [Planctomycetes bacterium]|nr:protein arginine kinase [Planctomycetota bacterium]
MAFDIDKLPADKPGEWLKGTGPESDIVVSTRIRLARNVKGYPFLHSMTEKQQEEVNSLLEKAFKAIDRNRSAANPIKGKLAFCELKDAGSLDRKFLAERHLISQEHAAGKNSRSVAFSSDERFSIMVNEEDHIRLQHILSGLRLAEAYEAVDKVDDEIEKVVEYSYHPTYGYLTACPTNVGTGLRASVMLHLPSLAVSKHIEKVFHSAKKMNLAVRGLYGENTQAHGDFYQISNHVTLGESEASCIRKLSEIVPLIVKFERDTRKMLIDENKMKFEDRIYRSLGMLRSARIVTSEEAMSHLSNLRVGVFTGLLGGIDIKTINQLFVISQPAHLQRLSGGELCEEDRDSIRAQFLREKLESN